MFPPPIDRPLHELVQWRVIIAIGADGAASIAAPSDPGASISHDDAGHYTLHFPESSIRRVDALTLWNPTGNSNTAHPHELLSDRVTIHTEVQGTLTDPDNGAQLFVTLSLGDLNSAWPRNVL